MNDRDDLPSGFLARDHSAVALACIVAAFAIVNSISQLVFSNKWNDFGFVICLGIWVFEPLSIGMWTALGSGSIFTRLPIAVPSLMLLFIAPGYVPSAFAEVQQGDFIFVVLVGFVVYANAVIVSVLFQKCARFQIQSSARRIPGDLAVRYSTKYLLVLLTLVGVVLGLGMQLKFERSDSLWGKFGTANDFLQGLIFTTPLLTTAVLPTLAIPLAILHDRPSRLAIALATVFRAIDILLFCALSMIELGEPLGNLGPALLAQVGASLTGAAAAVSLRVAGVRLVRYE